ncbi:hypothetical protein M514_19275 [Trichuris suis]|uniref:Uncharacterized protein n=1 Tax=Trichuris suis TaxID=68888 RepID=A0A085NG53_9BILA|nr:hypothetical protein M514_19275 [Trichuris suis]
MWPWTALTGPFAAEGVKYTAARYLQSDDPDQASVRCCEATFSCDLYLDDQSEARAVHAADEYQVQEHRQQRTGIHR